MKPRLTYANVMVTILAFIVLGGGAYAATQLPKNSVGKKQIKNGAVTRAKIADGAVDGSKVADHSLRAGDLSPSTLGGYAKSSELNGYVKGSDLNGYLKEVPNGSVGPDKFGTLPAAALEDAMYNVGGPGPNLGVDCFGADAVFPNGSPDDIDFSAVRFDNTGIASKENPSNNDCFNGFDIKRTGTYVIATWVEWEMNEEGDREIVLLSHDPSKGIAGLTTLAVSEQQTGASGEFEPPSQTVAAVARLNAGESVVVQGRQTATSGIGLLDGGLQAAWVGP
ncbi:MAG: hypothetical protein ACRDLL_09400 [Solirubrobacterales bacterium]